MNYTFLHIKPSNALAGLETRIHIVEIFCEFKYFNNNARVTRND